jgi:hypothetical protein
MMILPRQAPDKHRESTQNRRCVFRRGNLRLRLVARASQGSKSSFLHFLD